MSRYQKGRTNLDFTEARDSEWHWHQLGHKQVSTSLQTHNHASTPLLSFLQTGCPSCRPTNSVKALKATEGWGMITQSKSAQWWRPLVTTHRQAEEHAKELAKSAVTLRGVDAAGRSRHVRHERRNKAAVNDLKRRHVGVTDNLRHQLQTGSVILARRLTVATTQQSHSKSHH